MPTNEFYAQVESLKKSGKPFAVATVIAVKGSASAKPGSKALINAEGKNVWGWVGGGCAESFVARNALEAIEERRPRIVQADLDDEIFGLGMPCGGIMDVFIDPQVLPETIHFAAKAARPESLAHLASTLGAEARFDRPEPSCAEALDAPELERTIYELADALALSRGASFASLRAERGVFRDPAALQPAPVGELLIMGSSRITEELAAWGATARWRVRVYGRGLDPANYPTGVTLEESTIGYTGLRVEKGSAVVVASHHKGDHEFIQQALQDGAAYVGLVASPKRSGLVFRHLESVGVPEAALRTVYAPTGLDLQCRTPREIALSIVAEIIRTHRPGGRA